MDVVLTFIRDLLTWMVQMHNSYSPGKVPNYTKAHFPNQKWYFRMYLTFLQWLSPAGAPDHHALLNLLLLLYIRSYRFWIWIAVGYLSLVACQSRQSKPTATRLPLQHYKEVNCWMAVQITALWLLPLWFLTQVCCSPFWYIEWC